MKSLFYLCFCIALTFWACEGICHAHDVPVHERITQAAADTAFNYSTNFRDFLAVVSQDSSYLTNRLYLVEGSAREDDPVTKFSAKDSGGYRSMNHFYDPLDLRYGKGLSDFPPDFRTVEGTNSFAWGSISNESGIDVGWPVNNHGTYNTWSWQNARDYEWVGLTAASQSARIKALTNMFRAVGQVMHLLEDTSQPQHVRNEQHLDEFVKGVNTPWRSAIEDYGKINVNQLNYSATLLDWKGAGFTKLEDFWDRHLYSGANSLVQKSTVLNADANGGVQLGLAEWCNGNFLGARHLYAEYYQTNSIKYYPFPSRNTSTDYRQRIANLPSAVHPISLRNGQPGQAIYLAKTNDGIQMPFHSRFTYFGAKYPYFGMITINDNNVLSNYHNLVIPKAVQYSAGLIDYFFRGNLFANAKGGTNGFYDVGIVNASSQDLNGGGFQLYYDDAGSNRSPISAGFSSGYSTTLVSGGSAESSVTSVANAVKYILLFQGTIGAASGTNVDPVDTNIAIAVTNFTLPQLFLSPSNGTVGVAYTGTLTWPGISSPTFATNGTFPPGLTMDGFGNITGTPTNAGAFDFSVTATDGVTGYPYKQDFTITIVDNLSWNNLVWGDPVIILGDGDANSADASASGSVMSASASANDGIYGSEAGMTGSMTYSGGAVECNFHLELSCTPGSGCSFSVTSSNSGTLINESEITSSEIEDFPFTVPDSGGSDTLTVNFSTFAVPADSQSSSFSGKLTPAD